MHHESECVIYLEKAGIKAHHLMTQLWMTLAVIDNL